MGYTRVWENTMSWSHPLVLDSLALLMILTAAFTFSMALHFLVMRRK